MFKTFFNLLIIFLICVIATGISINASPILGNHPISTVDSQSDDEILLISNAQVKVLHNPQDITIKFKAKDEAALNFIEEYLFRVTIYKNEKEYKIKYLSKIEDKLPLSLNLTKDTPYSKTITISQEELQLPNGIYKLSIESTSDSDHYNIKPLMLNTEYISTVPYIPASNDMPKGKMGLNLYFPDSDYNIQELIGVTRFVNSSSKVLTTIIAELQKGPDSTTGLNLIPPIGKPRYIKLASGTVTVSLPSKESLYTSELSQANAAMNSFLKSLTSVNSVNKVRFLVDSNSAKTFFVDKDITNSIERKDKNRAYLALNTSTRYFLVDCSVDAITDDLEINNKIDNMFNALKNDEYLSLSNTIPNDVNLLSYEIDKNVLSLNMNRAFLSSFNGLTNLQRLMLDSILFSFTSIDNIKYVKLLIEGEPLESFAGVDTSKPLVRPLYINPEVN